MLEAVVRMLDNPGKVIFFIALVSGLFFISRLILDCFNSGWSKRVIKELGVLEKMREADLCSTPSGQKAVNGIIEHVSGIVIGKTTMRDTARTLFEAFQFSIIGLISLSLVWAWYLYWQQIDFGDKKDVVTVISVSLLCLLMCFLSDIVRLVIAKVLLPGLRRKKKLLSIYIHTRRIDEQQKHITRIWKMILDNSNMIIDLTKHTSNPMLLMALSEKAREQLVQIIEYKECIVREAIDMVDNYRLETGDYLNQPKGRLEKRIGNSAQEKLRNIKVTYISHIEQIEQIEFSISRVVQKYPNGLCLSSGGA